ncbi:MAG: hypothetical protein J3R72DRAFT_488703 [Linnemannia gamsii]|nr:MAG: hypothetical protein J3R72DRAFT_488703 [Linnemannia gamsii]
MATLAPWLPWPPSRTSSASLHRNFHHLLWRQVTICDRTHQGGLDVLKTHAHLVHNLYFKQRAINKFFQLNFPRLVSFRCDLQSLDPFQLRDRTAKTNYNEDLMAILSDFISRHATIQELVITSLSLYLSQQLWDTISTTLQTPRRLVIKELVGIARGGPKTKGPWFWRACTRFQDITYSGRDQSDYLEFADYDFSRVKRLNYTTRTGNAPKLWGWMCSCPNLARLHWGGNILLQQVATHLRLASGNFGQVCFGILREQHFGSLRTLAMRGAGLLSSQMALEVLQSCARLEEFRASEINLRDLRSSPQPWVCLGLKHLQVIFTSDPRDPEADSLMFGQLSTLTRLEELEMTPYGSRTMGWPTFAKVSPAWRVDNGLLQLSTLTRLRVFRIHKRPLEYNTEWRLEDFEWMLDHWPNLEVLSGNFFYHSKIKEERVDDRIKALIQQRGVSTH